MTHRLFVASAALIVAAVPLVASAQQGGMMRGMEGPFTLAQMQERADGRFTALDADHDGVLSAAEIAVPPTRGSMMSAGRGMDRADANQDGQVTLEEYHAQTAQMFARMDANGDGSVTTEELQAMRGMMRGPQGAQGGMMGQPGGGMPDGMSMPQGE